MLELYGGPCTRLDSLVGFRESPTGLIVLPCVVGITFVSSFESGARSCDAGGNASFGGIPGVIGEGGAYCCCWDEGRGG